MNKKGGSLIRVTRVFLLCAAVLSIINMSALSQPDDNRSVVLNIYLDWTGKALVTGYADDLQGLSFLSSAQYSYDNSTAQLYALTNTLTSKSGDVWSLEIQSYGSYERYSLMVYLPGDAMLSRISCSNDIGYLVSSSNQSLVVDLQGYDIRDPGVLINYQQPITAPESNISANISAMDSIKERTGNILIILLFIFITSGMAFWALRSRMKDVRERGSQAEPYCDSDIADVERADHTAEIHSEAVTEAIKEEGSEANREFGEETPPNILSQTFDLKPIEVTKEMAAILETLTQRERAVIQALLKRNGRMTQADLRYETGIPKSSLSGILNSLERRKLIKKREWGRTNVIELTEWFVSGKEHL